MTDPLPAAPESESPFKGKRGWRRLVRATRTSLEGLALAYRNESAFRQEVWLSVALAPVAILLPFDAVERVLLLGSLLVLLAIELVNSGVEAAIDRISFDRHHLSKRAKDMGSAAVMMALLLVALTWLAIAGPKLIALLGRG
jgi:diacylglycerol kinase (ATP)